MPVYWDCRTRIVKQNKLPPTVPLKGTKVAKTPGPNEIALPPLIGGNGYSHKRRAPAYEFGIPVPASFQKPATTKKAELLQVANCYRKGGKVRIPGGPFPKGEVKVRYPDTPGPDQYLPTVVNGTKTNPPKFSIKKRIPPPKEPWSSWTPGPNLYWPPLNVYKKQAPAISIKDKRRDDRPQELPGPGAYDVKLGAVKPSPPAHSLMPQRPIRDWVTSPAPNAHCDKLFKSNMKTGPAYSFGIRHSPYRGVTETYLVNP